MNEIELRSLEINMGDIEDDNLEVGGYIQTNAPSKVLGKEAGNRWREIIKDGVFAKAINRAIENGQHIDFLMDHDKTKILSSTSNESLFLDEDEVGLYIRAKISKTSWGQDLYTLIKDGIIKGLSFGMKVNESVWSRSADGFPLRTITDIDLFEISALQVPAYSATLIEARGFATEADINIPEGIEERELGGNGLNQEEEITPKHFYDGLTLIAEKLDNIVLKLSDIENQGVSKALEDAKEMLTKTVAVVEAQAKVNGVASPQDSEEVNPIEEKTGEAVVEDDAVEDEESIEPTSEETVEEEKTTAATDEEETEEIPGDEKELVDTEEEEVEEIVEDSDEIKKKKTEQRSLKDSSNNTEFKELLKKLKAEVPTIE